MYACIQSKYLVNKQQIKTQKTSSEKKYACNFITVR